MDKFAAMLLGIALLAGAVPAAEPEQRAYLGVSVREVEGAEDGVVVLSVVPGSPAQAAGLRAGDRIVTFEDGRRCGVDCFGARIRDAGPGTRLVIRFVRSGDTREAEAVLGRSAGVEWSAGSGTRFEAPEVLLRNRLDAMLAEVPDPPAPPELFLSPASRVGLDLIQTTPELRRHLGGPADAGALVGEVKPDSAADRAGIRTGDLLVGVDGRPVRGGAGWVILLNTLNRPSLEVELVRDGETRVVTVELPVRQQPRDMPSLWWEGDADRSEALQTALQSLESGMESLDMSQDLRDHLEAVREQLQRALNPPPKQAPAGR